IEHYGIDCDFERTGIISVATEQYQVDAMAPDHDPAAGREWLDADALRDHIRSPQYLGGLRETRTASIVDPAKLCWGLQRVIQDLGVEVYENSIVRSLDRAGEQIVLTTDAGTLEAHHVALGTNAF